MTYQHKNNSGSLFPNDRKDNEKQPDYKGSAIIDGKEFWLSAWERQGGRGVYFSVSISPKEAAQPRSQYQPKQEAAPQKDSFEDDIPF